MRSIVIHSRYYTFDFDNIERSGQLFDNEAIEGCSRACERLLPVLGSYSNRAPKTDLEETSRTLPEALGRIARNYWQDDDYDHRRKTSHVKAEAQELALRLTEVVDLLSHNPFYVRQALNSVSGRFSEDLRYRGQDVYDIALSANASLLEACKVFSERRNRKSGGATRFVNASRDLVQLWEATFGLKFPRDLKPQQAHDSEKRKGIDRTFGNPAPQFVFDAIYEIGCHWPKFGQVQQALRSVFAGR